MNEKMDIFYSCKSNEWETPKYVYNYLNNIYHFELDAAATKENTLCENYFTLDNNSLEQDWFKYKSVFCNPPYGRNIGKFVEKAYQESLKGCTVVLLIPARVDTRWWHSFCSLGKIMFLKGRLKFINRTFPSWREDGNFKISPANFPSAIVIFGTGETTTKYIKLSSDDGNK
jgi:site-specific DNA-methyltransferase (adenine-specific)